MALKAIFHFRNLDSTKDLNDRYKDLFVKGVYTGGEVTPVPGELRVDVLPFKVMGYDGMMVEDTETTRLDVVAGQTNYVCLRAVYNSDSPPLMQLEVLEESVYNSDPQKEWLVVFCTVRLLSTQSEVFSSDIKTLLADVLDPSGRLAFRGWLESTSNLPGVNNRIGDFWVITDGTGDVPNMYVWNGVIWVNVTTAGLVSGELALHRQNLFANEIHLTDAQAAALVGTSGTPPGPANPFVDTSDPRIPTQSENDALQGSDGTPSDVNRFLTQAKILAVPAEVVYPTAPSTGSLDLFAALLPFTPASSSDWDYDDAIFGAGSVVLEPVAFANIRSKGAGVASGDVLTGAVTYTGGSVDVQFESFSNPGVPLSGGYFTDVRNDGTPETNGGDPIQYSIPVGVNNIVMRIINPTGTGSTISSTSLILTSSGSYRFTVVGSEGPFYVGKAGLGTPAQYFNLYDVNELIDKEYANSKAEPVKIVGIYTDSNFTNELVPASSVNVDAEGFYGEAGALPMYFLVDKEIDTGFRFSCGKKETYKTVPVDMLIRRGPKFGQLDRRLSGTTHEYQAFHVVPQWIKNITDNGNNTYTIESTNHIFVNGESVTIDEVDPSGFNGTYTVGSTGQHSFVIPKTSGLIYNKNGKAVPDNKTTFEVRNFNFNENDSAKDVVVKENQVELYSNDGSIRPIVIRTGFNDIIDLKDSIGNTYAVTLSEAVYNNQDDLIVFSLAIKQKLNLIPSPDTFNVTYNNDYTFSIQDESGNFELLFGTGANASQSVASTLGFDNTNLTGGALYTSQREIDRGIVQWEKLSTVRLKLLRPVQLNGMVTIERMLQDSI